MKTPITLMDLKHIANQCGLDENHILRYLRLAQITNNTSGESVLDIGCGYGILELLLNKKSCQGIDVDKNAIIKAKILSERFDSNASFEAVDLFKFNPVRRYDIIVCSEVLEHLKDYLGAIERIRNFLFPNGKLILTVPNRNRTLNRFRRLLGYKDIFMSVGPKHLREYSLKEITRLLKSGGFEIESREGIYFQLPRESALKKTFFFGLYSPFRKFLEFLFPTFCVYLLIIARAKPRTIEFISQAHAILE